MLEKGLDRLRPGRVIAGAAAIAAAAVSPVLGRDRGKNDRGGDDGNGNGTGNDNRAERRASEDHGDERSVVQTDAAAQRARTGADGDGRVRDRGRDTSRDEAQRSHDHAQESDGTVEDQRQSADGGGGDVGDGGADGDVIGGRVGEAAARLRHRGEKLTGADGGHDGDGDGHHIAVTVDPATGGLDVKTDNIALIRDDDGAVTIDTGNIFFRRGPDPESTPFPTPGFLGEGDLSPTPRPDGGDNNMDMVS